MTLLWSLWLSVAAALSPADLTEANKAYSDGEFSLASQLYVDMIEEGALSGDLYYNLGNSLYREGRPGHAILSWWRALVLQPRDADALANMERVRDELGIVSEIPGRSGPLFINASLSEKEQAWMAAFFGLFSVLWGCLACGVGLFSGESRPCWRGFLQCTSPCRWC